MGLVIAGLVLVAIGAVVAERYFLPERAMRVSQAAPEGAVALKQGTFEGAGDGAHHVSGRVQVLQADGAYYLRFEEYDQTQGPDVFVYLTQSADARSTSEVESGLRVLIEGGADGGESTKEGDFQQRLPDGFDPSRYDGVVIWCDQFNVLFGRAALAGA